MFRITRVFIVLLYAFIPYLSTQAQEGPPFWGEVQALVLADIRQPKPRNEILFIGSSSFRLWQDVETSFPGKTIINAGIGGSTLLNQVQYIDYLVTPYRPRQVVIYCGENDLAYDPAVTAIEVLNRFKQLVTEIRKRLPEAYITYVSMKPSPSRADLLNIYREGNLLIESYLKSVKRSSYVNVYDAMFEDVGKPREDLFLEDRLHMNEKGYALWKTLLALHLK
jgi:lysophospholipase L1-like esterase